MSDLAALQAENERLLAFLYLCPTGVVQFAADGMVQMINPHAALSCETSPETSPPSVARSCKGTG